VMHSWRNDLDQPARMVGIVYGAHHRGAPLRRSRSKERHSEADK
jgi:hypothetical protein